MPTALDDAIRHLEESQVAADARSVLRPLRGAEGLSSAYFGRLLQLYGSDPAATMRLARWWRLVLQYGDDAALAYRAKGAADRIAGKWTSSAKAFVRAGDLADDDVSRLSYKVGAIDGLAKCGKVEEALTLGSELASGLDRLGETGLASRVRLNLGNALLWADRNVEARSMFELALPALESNGYTTEAISARLGLSTTHLFSGNPQDVMTLAERGLFLSKNSSLEYLAALFETNIALALMLRGQFDESLSRLLTLRPSFSGSPTDQGRLAEYLGDAYLRLNLWTEAVDSYNEALTFDSALAVVNRADIHLGLAQSFFALGDEAATIHVRTAERLYRRAGNEVWVGAALTTHATMEMESAPKVAESLAMEARGRAFSSPYHAVQALLVTARARLKQGRPVGRALADAEALIARYGFAQSEWQVAWLRAMGARSPLKHYRAMLELILRDRLVQTSVIARVSFLRDKAEAIGSYLNVLLERARPADVREALDVITRTRSVTLLDELLGGAREVLSEEQRQLLENLREELRSEQGTLGLSPDTRRVSSSTETVPGIQRRWVEATHALDTLNSAISHGSSVDCVVLSEVEGNLFTIINGRAIRLPASAEQVDTALRWLRFDLLSPLTNRNSPEQNQPIDVSELAEMLVRPWISESSLPIRICPDGVLWRVPWDLLLNHLGREECATVCLHPTLTLGATNLSPFERVAVWFQAAPDLPNAATELETVLQRYPHACVARTRAEVERQFSSEWDLVHVIGHAKHNRTNPMFSFFDYPDGPVYAAEIARSQMRLKLVCLSACDTGAVTPTNRDEPDGMVRAFLSCGAKAALASLWPLDDEAASMYFSALYADLDKGTDLEKAALVARRKVRSWKSHPYFWGGITLFGGC